MTLADRVVVEPWKAEPDLNAERIEASCEVQAAVSEVQAGLLGLLHRYLQEPRVDLDIDGRKKTYTPEPQQGLFAQPDLRPRDESASSPRICIRTEAENHSTDAFGLMFLLQPRDGVVQVRVQAVAMSSAALGRLLEHLQNLIQAARANPSEPLACLPLLTDAERKLVARTNQTQASFDDKNVLLRFEAEANRRPEALAVVDGARQWTYGDLDRAANRLAHRLIARGVTKGQFVQIGLPRSFEFVATTLAVWKAGGAYIPVDPSYPEARLQAMLDDAPDAVLVTDETRAAQFSSRNVLRIEDGLQAGVDQRPVISVESSAPAYAVYTSGSTGRPKGVVITHQSLSNLLDHTVVAFGMHEQRRVLQFSSTSFDVSVWEIFATLTEGAALVIAGDDEVYAANRLIELCRRQRVDMVFLLAAFIAGLEPADFPSVKVVVTGGELFSQALVDRWGRGRRVIYVYGPTEATIFQSYFECPVEAVVPPPTVGQPLANLRYYLVDAHLQPVPIGVPGELLIAGIGVGQGYLGRPELNAEKFLDEATTMGAFSQGQGRLYRSGDRAVYREDGHLDFLGRVDHQLKIRGFRIEPGEIEIALLSHPDVDQAVVVPQRLSTAETCLVAYVVQKPGQSIHPDALRRYLEPNLPSYMIPQGFMTIERLPRAPGGKVDRRALPPYVPVRIPAAATNAKEAELVRIWEDVLGVPNIGIDDRFFDLGGQSLKAMAILARVEREQGISLRVRDLFEHPTVRMLARFETSSAPKAVPLAPGSRSSRVPLSITQRRLWLLDQSLGAQRYVYNVPVAYAVTGDFDEARFLATVETLSVRHEILRTRFVEQDGEPWQVIRPNPAVSFERTSITDDAGLAGYLTERAQRPFELAEDALLRIEYIEGPETRTLLVNMPHIICDAWSQWVLFDELVRGYRGQTLAPLAFQYQDFARWQAQRRLEGEFEEHADYWAEKLPLEVPPLALPIDFPRTANGSYAGNSVRFTFDTENIDRLAAATATSHYVVLTSLVKVLLFEVTQARTVTVGSPIAGRSHPDLANLLGFFVNTVVIENDVEPTLSFEGLVRRVHQTVLDAFEHQDCPFETVVRRVKRPVLPSRHPLFDVWVALQDSGQRILDLGEATLTRFDFPFDPAWVELFFLFEARRDLKPAWFEGRLQYNTDLYAALTIDRLVDRFVTLVEELGAMSDRPLEEWLPFFHDRAAASLPGFAGFDF